MTPARGEIDRRQFIVLGGALAAATVVVACDPETSTVPRSPKTIEASLTGSGPGWGEGWLNVHYASTIGRRNGIGSVELDPAETKAIRDDLIQAEYMGLPVVLTTTEVSDVEVSCDVRAHGAIESGVIARWDHDEAYALVLGAGRLILYRYSKTDRRTLADAPFDVRSVWVKLRLELAGDHLSGRATSGDDSAEVSARDDDPLPSGLVGALANPIDDSEGGRALFRALALRVPEPRPPEPRVAYGFTGAVVSDDAGYRARVAARSVLADSLAFEFAESESFEDATRVGPFVPEGKAGQVRAWLGDLDGAKTYYWRPIMRDGNDEVRGPVKRFRTPPAPGEALRFGFACCTSGRVAEYPSFPRAAEHDLDFYLHAGDWGYADQNTYVHRADHFQTRWTRLLRIAEPLLAMTPLLFWQDDHDYQADNGWAGTIVPYTVDAFDEIHANPTDTYFDFYWGDAHVFCIDCRLFADDPALPDGPGKSRLGREQKSWLMKRMSRSSAPVRIVASPMVFRNKVPEDPGWHNVYAHERDELLGFFSGLDATTLILSGDSHGQRLIHHFEFGDLFEVNSSGTDFPHGPRQGNNDPEHTLFNFERNGFAVIELDPAGDSRTLTARVIESETGDVLFEKSLPVRG